MVLAVKPEIFTPTYLRKGAFLLVFQLYIDNFIATYPTRPTLRLMLSLEVKYNVTMSGKQEVLYSTQQRIRLSSLADF